VEFEEKWSGRLVLLGRRLSLSAAKPGTSISTGTTTVRAVRSLRVRAPSASVEAPLVSFDT
jgi:hypothetical protein